MKDKLSAIDPYFTKLGEAMVVWIDAWGELNNPNAKAAGGSLNSAAGGQSSVNGPAKPPVPPVKKP